MTNEAALDFLRRNQPLPPTSVASNDLFPRFEEVRRLLTCDPDERGIMLLIGALGEGDGHGTYQMVETTLQAYPRELVVAALKQGLTSEHSSVRYWSAQFAAGYRDEQLLPLLVEVCERGSEDERIAAVTAIEAIGTSSAMRQLRSLLATDLEPSVKELIQQVLGH